MDTVELNRAYSTAINSAALNFFETQAMAAAVGALLDTVTAKEGEGTMLEHCKLLLRQLDRRAGQWADEMDVVAIEVAG